MKKYQRLSTCLSLYKNLMHEWSVGHVSVYGTAGTQIMCNVMMKEAKRRNSIIVVYLFILEFGISSTCCVIQNS
jgi:hypothetical protein